MSKQSKDIQRIISNHDAQSASEIIVEEILLAHSKQTAIAFAKWIGNNELDFQRASEDRLVGLNLEYLTTEQLYELFLQSQK